MRRKMILTSSGFVDAIVPATYITKANHPTIQGHFLIWAYRIKDGDGDGLRMGAGVATPRRQTPLGWGRGSGASLASYSAWKVPHRVGRGRWGGGNQGGGGRGTGQGIEGLPVRIHDQCFTSEVFGSQR
jgi:hypothetical protein